MRRLGLGLALLLAATVACQPDPTPPPTGDALPVRAVGVRYGPTPADIATYEQWLGGTVDTALFYFDGQSAAELTRHAAWLTDQWRDDPRQTLVFSMPLVLPGQTLAQVARGANDQLFRSLARTLVAAGRGDDVVRPGWELNGRWFDWSALDHPRQYAKAFRRAVETMRSVPGAEHLRVEWNVARGGEPVPEEAYPGDDVVDVIGMDLYDRTYGVGLADPATRWQHYLDDVPGLNWLTAFATAHNKPIGFSEWALSSVHVEGVSADNPYFIERMYEFIQANNVAYAIYFEDDTPSLDHMLSRHYPVSAERYRSLFVPR